MWRGAATAAWRSRIASRRGAAKKRYGAAAWRWRSARVNVARCSSRQGTRKTVENSAKTSIKQYKLRNMEDDSIRRTSSNAKRKGMLRKHGVCAVGALGVARVEQKKEQEDFAPRICLAIGSRGDIAYSWHHRRWLQTSMPLR